MKHCGGCNLDKSLLEFHKNKLHKDGLSIQCKDCQKARAKEWYHSHKEYMKEYRLRTTERRKEVRLRYSKANREKLREYERNYDLLKNYGISRSRYLLMRKKQGDKCLICEVPQSECEREFNVDHDHKTGNIRGLLCCNCNIGIGNLHDDAKLLTRAIEYLRGEFQFTRVP
jgi:hypothetical protein